MTIEVKVPMLPESVEDATIALTQGVDKCLWIFAPEDIALEQGKKFIKITIRDSGIGIPENVIDKIFDPYFTTKSEGSGLGLAISHSIITKHQGHIDVWSKPGKGTAFNIYLPASPIRTISPERRSEEENFRNGGGMSILLMDDDDTVREVPGNMLEFMGYDVAFATEGQEALDLYRISMESGDPYAIVIMDLTVPGGMGGQETVGEILKINPLARVIVSSGYSNDPVLANYTDYGFKAVIVKPFQMNELSSAINKALR